MFTVTKYPHGHFSWADGLSTDQQAAKKFYTAVMGWDVNDVPMGDGQFYTMFEQDGKSIAGLGQMPPEMQEQGIPSIWTSYINVDDVDAATEKAKSLGATVTMDVTDVFDSGRMSMIQDPVGAQVGLWQAKSHIGAGLVNTPSAMTWNELSASKIDGAPDFYNKLFGWEINKDENREYYYITNKGRMNGGMLPMGEDYANIPPFWMVYFSVADLDAAMEKVKANGGTIHVGKIEAPGVGHLSVIADPTGGVCTIIQLDQPQPWEE